jgi:hypothetical protein
LNLTTSACDLHAVDVQVTRRRDREAVDSLKAQWGYITVVVARRKITDELGDKSGDFDLGLVRGLRQAEGGIGLTSVKRLEVRQTKNVDRVDRPVVPVTRYVEDLSRRPQSQCGSVLPCSSELPCSAVGHTGC